MTQVHLLAIELAKTELSGLRNRSGRCVCGCPQLGKKMPTAFDAFGLLAAFDIPLGFNGRYPTGQSYHSDQ